MELAIELQAHVLRFLPDDVLYTLASPHGLGVAAFNHFYRRLTVVNLSQTEAFDYDFGTESFTVKAARCVFSVRQFMDFVARHPYYQPHTLEFESFTAYVDICELAPTLLGAATSLELNFYDACHPQLEYGTIGEANWPGLLANVRVYTAFTVVDFGQIAQNLASYLPQLEEFHYMLEINALDADDVDLTHNCDFDHPTLRKLQLTIHTIRLSIDLRVVSLPKCLQELEVIDVRLSFDRWFSFENSALSALTLGLNSKIEFAPGSSLDSFTQLREFESHEGYYRNAFDLYGQDRLESLVLTKVTSWEYFEMAITPNLTKLDFEFDKDSFGGEMVPFPSDFLALRELRLSFDGPDPSGFKFSGSLPVSLQKLDLTACHFESTQWDLGDLRSLESLHLKDCSFVSLALPVNLKQCSIDMSFLEELKLPAGLKALTLVGDHLYGAVVFNAALESLTFNPTLGQSYHNLPNVKTLILNPASARSKFVLTPDTITLPWTLTTLNVDSLDAMKLKLPPSLVNLRLVKCSLTQFPTLPKLESLDVSHNNIALPSTIQPSLRSLNVSRNKCSTRSNWSKSNLRFLIAEDIGSGRIRLPPCTDVAGPRSSSSLYTTSQTVRYAPPLLARH